jgi:hypothetical protein
MFRLPYEAEKKAKYVLAMKRNTEAIKILSR